ncbi:HIRAN domain-containing protein [Streptosporangium sandarakinum]
MVIGKRSNATHLQAANLSPFDLWGHNGWCNQEVAGESHYLPALEKVLRVGGKGLDEFETTALLVPEPANRHDPNAVAVLVQHETVGYLPRKDAARYQALLSHLAASGFVARVPCRVWGGRVTDHDYDRAGRVAMTERFRASVTIALAEPHLCLPVNTAPQAPHVVLPQGGAIQVSGEEHHLAEIKPLLRAEGESYAYATLHEVNDSSGRAVKQIVEVRLDGNRVGQLTPKMSGELLPAIRHLDGMGYLAAARAKLKGNHLKAEVTLYCVRAHELPHDWPGPIGHALPNVQTVQRSGALTGGDSLPVGPTVVEFHAPIPPRPTRIRFVVPPGWPPAPEGWEPPPGWRPDPSWPKAPDGWSFWVAE